MKLAKEMFCDLIIRLIYWATFDRLRLFLSLAGGGSSPGSAWTGMRPVQPGWNLARTAYRENLMKVHFFVLGICFLSHLTLAQGTSGVAVTSGAGAKDSSEVLAGAGLPPDVRSEAISATNTDPRPSYWGTWESFRKLFAAGHDVQSHPLCHGNVKSPKWQGIEGEYAESKKEIEKNIPGNRCLVMAYPDGAATEGMKRLAAKYFIGARGGAGGLNGANQFDYLLTRSLGGRISIEPSDQPWKQVRDRYPRLRPS